MENPNKYSFLFLAGWGMVKRIRNQGFTLLELLVVTHGPSLFADQPDV